MSQLYSLAREMTGLTDVQIKILDHIQKALPFAADIAKSQIYICAKGNNKRVSVVLLAEKPSYTMGNTYFRPGDAYFDEEFALVENVFATGHKVVGRKELDFGRMVALTAYPVVDNAGVPFAVVAFMSNSQKQQQVLTDTAYMLLQVPLESGEYQNLRPQDGMMIIDSVGRIIYANDMAEDLYFVLDKETADKKEISGHTVVHFPLVDTIMETKKPAYGEKISGEMTLSAWGMPILSGGRVSRTVLLISDVTAVREKEKQILVKDSVIREIHHRVKNSLNTIAGMLRLQARRSDNEETKTALKIAVNRIMGIAQIHDILAVQSGDRIDWNILLDKMCKLSLDSLATCRVELIRERTEKPCIVLSEKALPLAIASNELIHNAIDHGFNGLEKGQLAVGTKIENNEIHVYIKNDGIPLPPSFNQKTFDLGLQIVRTLVEIELNGTFELKNENGRVAAHIRCPVSMLEGSDG